MLSHLVLFYPRFYPTAPTPGVNRLIDGALDTNLQMAEKFKH
jgi:hypothetical protein